MSIPLNAYQHSPIAIRSGQSKSLFVITPVTIDVWVSFNRGLTDL